MNKRIYQSLLAVAAICCCVTVFAADDERPRIGLVLGGGGARGAAHIGVLQELERQRIPVHAIAGTSMGAVVGALYAAGHTPDELRNLIDTIDWADAFDDQPARERLAYRRKQDDAAFPIPLELGLRDGSLQLPKGLIQGQKLNLILREQLLHVADITDFDQLPIPFRAVAADIESGEAYVMSSGDLEMAARASMSAPGIFAPAVVDGRTLVDGGLVGNVPVGVMREMDVDVIIAVDVEFPLYTPDQLSSALQITEQMLTILINQETQRQLALLAADDILIRPELGDYASTNFDDIVTTLAPGGAAAAAAAERLAPLALPEHEYSAHQAARKQLPAMPTHVDRVRVIDDGELAPAFLEARMRSAPGDAVDAGNFAADVERLYGFQTYEEVGYRLLEEDDGTVVEYATRSKSWGPNFLRFGLASEDDFEGSTAFNLSGRLTLTGVNAAGAEWRNDVQLGTDPRFDFEFYQPFRNGSRYFVAPRLRFAQDNINAFSGDASVARYRVSELEASVGVGRELGRWGELRLGAYRGNGNARLKIGDPLLPNFDFNEGGAFVSLAADTLDDAQFPRHGTRFGVEWLMSRPGLGADSDFDTVEAVLDSVISWDRNTLQLGLEYATTIRSDNLVQNFFPLGGFLRFSGLERGELGGPHAALARLVYYRKIDETGGGLFDIPLYVGGSVEAGNVGQTRSDIDLDSLVVNGSIFAGLDSYIGPLFLAAGFSEDGETSFYLFLGTPQFRR